MAVTKEKLSALISDIQEKVYELKTFDKTAEINGYCDELMSQVALTFESATKHLNKIQQQLTDEINMYRDQLLYVLRAKNVEEFEDESGDDSYGETDTDDEDEDDIESSDDDGSIIEDEAKEEKPAVHETLDEDQVKQELETLSNKVQELSSQCSVYTESKRSGDNKEDQELVNLKAEADTYMQRCREIQTKLRDHAFQHKFMKFKENHLFALQTDYVGTLEFSKTEFEAKKEFKTPVVVETQLKSIELYGYPTKVAFLPNGMLAQCGHDEYVTIWDPKTGEDVEMSLKPHLGRVTTIAVLPDGNLVSAGREGNIVVWDVRRKPAKVINAIEFTSGQEIYLLKPLANGHLASFSEDDVLEVWDPYTKNGNCILTLKKRGVDGGADVLSNGYFVTYTSNREGECRLKVWNPQNGRLVKQIHTYFENVTAMCVLSNDEIVMGDADGQLHIVDVLDVCQSRAIPDETEDTGIDTLMELPNGLLLVSQRGDELGFKECFLKIWNLQTGVILQRFKAHDRLISCFCISPDHKFLATGPFDDHVKIWTLNL